MKLGRLFWKFFFFFWLAQLVTSFGVGLTIWMLRPDPMPRPASLLTPPTITQEQTAQPIPPRRVHGVAPHARPWWSPMRPLRSPLVPLLAGGVVSLLFAALLAWYFARPIRSLRGAFESVAAGRLDTRIGATMSQRRDELADLGGDFDRMAERLQGLVQGQQRLLHDVSHELRSPLARLQAITDLMRQQPERSAELLERIDRDTGRMDRLVGELLTLARLDAGTAGRMDETPDLTELLTQLAEDARLEAEPRHGRIELDLSGVLTLQGNGELLHRAIENIVRNAVRHSPEGGRIGIAAQRHGQRIEITVDDEGPGVAPHELASIFEPFVRGQSATASSGYGLGLAITRRIVQAHGGSIHASNRPTGGLRVMLNLPTRPAPETATETTPPAAPTTARRP